MRRIVAVLLGLALLALLAPAVVLTVVRAVEPDGPLWYRLTSFTPIALALYAAVFVLMLLRAAATRSGPRRPWLVAALVVLLPLAVHGWWFSPQVRGGDVPAAEDAPVITVVSANLLAGAGDARQVLAEAVERDADVLVLQEITPGGLTEMEAAGLDTAFPHRAGEVGATTEGTMILAAGPLTDVARVGTVFGSWAATLDLDGAVVRIFGIHTRPPIDEAEEWVSDHRTLQVDARAALDADPPVLFAGDFNATPDHRPMRDLSDLGLRSVAELTDAGWQPTWPATRISGMPWTAVGPLVQIDHVLVERRLAALEFDRFAIPGSDHTAVLARVAVR